MSSINYDSVAGIYDIYADTDYDFEFFVKEVWPGAKVLELTSGTGRLSVPLAQAGAQLTCVDISRGMLDVLERKLLSKGLAAEVICADVEALPFDGQFELAIFPFQSFMEIIGQEKQAKTLTSIYNALAPGGKFFCTLHNPQVRRKSVDGCLRIVGKFATKQGSIVVSGFEQGGTPIVTRSQFFEHFNHAGEMEKKELLNMQFELIEHEQFTRLASQAGFRARNLFGDYDRNKFSAASSPVMIWELER